MALAARTAAAPFVAAARRGGIAAGLALAAAAAALLVRVSIEITSTGGALVLVTACWAVGGAVYLAGMRILRPPSSAGSLEVVRGARA